MEHITIKTDTQDIVRLEKCWKETDSERYTITFNRSAVVSLLFALEEAIGHHGWSAAEAKLILQLEEIIYS